MRLAGHKLTIEWNGERGVESASTGTCTCGWQESGSSQEVVRSEYRWHLDRERRAADYVDPRISREEDRLAGF